MTRAQLVRCGGSRANIGTQLLLQVTLGRLGGNTMAVNDNEVSGKHVAIRWDPSCRCWQVMSLQNNLCALHVSNVDIAP